MWKGKLSRGLTLRSGLIAMVVIIPVAWSLWVAHSATRTWTGAAGAGINFWTVAQNWTSNTPPVPGDDLIFPVGASQNVANNNFPLNTAFNSITLNGSSYTLIGNGIALTQGITSNAGGNQVLMPIRLDSSQRFTSNSAASLLLTNNINTNGFNLDLQTIDTGTIIVAGNISGAGEVEKLGTGTAVMLGSNSYTGRTFVRGGSLIVNGSQPQSPVSVLDGSLRGIGTLGPVHVGIGTASPGPPDSIPQGLPFSAINPGGIEGTSSETGILNLNGDVTYIDPLAGSLLLSLDLNSPTVGTGYDQLNVNGGVDLGTLTRLDIDLGFNPHAGTTFIIINNDNNDAVSGTFLNLPEGASFTIGATTFFITYGGGDGNDVVLHVPTTRIWDGGGADDNWTTAANWVADVPPQVGDDLVFPAGAARLTNNNNFPADTTFNSISNTGTGYTLNGNAVRLVGGLTNNIPDSGNNTINLAIGGTGTLTTTGAGTFARLVLTANNTYSGTTTVNGGVLTVNGNQPASSVLINGGNLDGVGTVGPVTANGGGVVPGTTFSATSAGILSAVGNVTLNPNSRFSAFFIDDDSSILNVTGAVTLNNCGLNLGTVIGPMPFFPGTDFTLISNDGTDPVNGTFGSLPEGFHIGFVGRNFRLTYRGGDGNDVVLQAPRQRTWDGGGSTSNWTEAANWVGDVAPSPVDDLVFQAGAAQLSNNNDFPTGTTFNTITFSGGGYSLSGNGIALNNGIADTSSNDANRIALASIKLNSNQVFSNNFSMTIESTLDTNGQTLTLAGAGDKSLLGPVAGTGGLVINGTGLSSTNSNPGINFTNSFSGPTVVNAGIFRLGIAQPNSQVQLNGGILTGSNTLNSIVATGGTIQRSFQQIMTSNNNVTLASGVTYEVGILRNSQGAFNGRLNVNGNLNLGNSTLTIDPDFLVTPAAGEMFTIINKVSSGAVQGTFNNLSEGSVLLINGLPYSISYVGGTGNDVVLTARAGLSINDVSIDEGNSGTTNASFTVTLSPAASQIVTVNFATANGTATAGSDYVATSGTLTFNPNETSKTVTVQINGDSTVEPDETFTVNLTNPSKANLADDQGVGTIVDDDADSIQFSAATYTAGEGDHITTITVTRTGNTSVPASVEFETADGTATEKKDYTTALGTLRFAASETQKTFNVLLTDDGFAEPAETINLILSNPIGTQLGSQATAALTVTDNELGVPSLTNPIDDPPFFVRIHYHDFFTREPDPPGFQFWTNQITECGSDVQCTEIRRINVSAAFYISIEFQETGYLVYRFYKAAFGNLPGKPVPVQLRPFLKDTQRIGEGVQVGIGDWELQLEQNKQAFAQEFVARSQFIATYPIAMPPEQFVDTLNANANGALSTAERNQLVAELISGAKTRAEVVRAVAEDQTLEAAEFRKAFVLMQYFGYLRRNPDDPPEISLDFSGYNFWLNKLNQFNGNFIEADMVKSFIVSGEYKERFR